MQRKPDYNLPALLRQEAGMTIVEFLIAGLMTLMVGGAALEFYVNQHEGWITQENISEAQQSLRASAQELSAKLRNAGAALPDGLVGIAGSNSNPDTITVRYSAAPTTLAVGDPTNKQQAVPIHVDRYSILEGFNVGDRVYIYRPSDGVGEFFTITKLSDNAGAGWKEVHHQGQALNRDPQPGDIIIKLSENRFYVDYTTDTLNPMFVREVNGVPQLYADQIYDLQGSYTLSDGTVVDQPVAGDTVVAVEFSIAAQTAHRNLTLAGDAGILTRVTSSRVNCRNRPGA